ncbi:hypothetical protein DPMN_018372 [Dreissena polymorpha]|uniref:Uncharacterized protein n=1 Tax=Dreissena polymorpha TaxID=45954 RepID=A0A9D4NIK4_DREPO|nr:hypothetical protein DPMN_018356 [Dreissena polymorpha]KAH3894216.1 hypothetical protein DPMN_018372 [Dreissena polymorpha]
MASRRHKPSTRTPERLPQYVERTKYRRPRTLPLSSKGHLEIVVCISATSAPSVLYAAYSAAPVPLPEM